jgi:hypothetical protein
MSRHGDGLYQRPDSAVFWITYQNADGRRVRESTHTTDRDTAKRVLEDKKGRIARGDSPLPRMDRVPYTEAREDLLTYYRVHGTRNITEAEGRLDHLDPYFTGARIARIGAAEVEAYALHRQQAGAANATINRELATLSKMLRLAYEHRKLERAPVVKKLREADPRAGFVSRQEFDAIAKHLPDDLRTAALVAFVLGWRKREVLGPASSTQRAAACAWTLALPRTGRVGWPT